MAAVKWLSKSETRLALLPCVIALLLFPGLSTAQSQALHWEVSGDANLLVDDALTKQFGFDTAYFLKPLAYTNGPYSERYFVNPTDTVRVSTQLESSIIDTTDTAGSDTSLSYTLVLGKHIFTPQVTFSEYEGLSAFGTGLTYTNILQYGVQASINARVSNEELSTGSADVVALGVGYKKLWQFKKARALATQVQLQYTRATNESQANNILELDADIDYYFNNRWSVGLGLDVAESDISRHQLVGLDLSTEFYFTRKFSLEFEAKVRDQDKSFDAGLLLNAKIYFD